MIEYLFSAPVVFFALLIIFAMTLSVHEFAHAYVADILGDPTAKYMGRLTLNPVAHLDPIGTLLIIVAGFGWGKPVPVNSVNFKQPRRDSALVAVAGPVSNIIFAIVLTALLNILPIYGVFSDLIYLTIVFNLTLAVFNLIPIFPLDGFNVVYGILPLDLAWQWQELRKYGIFILLFLLITGTIGILIRYPVSVLLSLLGF